MAVITYDPGFTPWEETQRNLARNPRAVNTPMNDEWLPRDTFTRAFIGTAPSQVAKFAATQAGRVDYPSVGWDIYGSVDADAPGNGNWSLIPVGKGESISVRVSVNSDVNVVMRIRARVHNGYGGWSSGRLTGPSTAVRAWQEVTATFIAPASGFMVFAVDSEPVAMTDGQAVRGNSLLIERAPQPGTYFDGNTANTRSWRYYWTGSADQSESVREVRSYGPQSIVPLLVEGYEASRRSQNVVHDVLGRADPDVTLRPASSRSGRLTLLIQTEVESLRVERALTYPLVFTLRDDDRSTVKMTFIVGPGDITRTLDDATRDVWHLSFPFQEVTA